WRILRRDVRRCLGGPMINERTIAAGGRTTRILEAGEGRPLVLLHAFPLSAEMWRPQLTAPPDGWRIVAPDFRGFGRTPLPPLTPGASIDDFAEDVDAVLDAAGIERAVIGGQSMGGYVSLALFRRSPQRFTGMVLADTRSASD